MHATVQDGRPGQTKAVVRIAVRRVVPVAVGGSQPRRFVVPGAPAKHAALVIGLPPAQYCAQR